MIARLRSKLTYANVVASMALFIALGGTGYAAIKLPHNSVGSAQLRSRAVTSTKLKTGAVTSRAIDDHSVGVADLSSAAMAALRGQTGPQGPAGPTGLTLRAAVPSGGTVQRGNATGAAHQGGTNQYRVSFAIDVSSCVATATLASVPNGPGTDEPTAGRITVKQDQPLSVLVGTYDASGNPAEEPFNLLLAC